MSTSTDPQDRMLNQLADIAQQPRDATYTIEPADDSRYTIVMPKADRHGGQHVTVTRDRLLSGITEWSELTIRYWDSDQPREYLDAARAFQDGRFDAVDFSGETAEVVVESTLELQATFGDPFWATVRDYLDLARVTSDAQTLIATTRTMFPDENHSTGPDKAHFPGSGGDEQLSGALREAGWTFSVTDGNYFYSATAPNGTQLVYAEGDLELDTTERPDVLHIPMNDQLWHLIDEYARTSLLYRNGSDSLHGMDLLPEDKDDAADQIAAEVLRHTARPMPTDNEL